MPIARSALVFAVAIIEMWASIPMGLAFNLGPVLTGILTAAGAIIGVVIVAFAGDHLRSWIIRRRVKSVSNPNSLFNRIWRRWGIIGLGLLAPFLTGAPIGAALGIALGAPARRVVVWGSLGIILWTVILTSLAALGFAGIRGFWR